MYDRHYLESKREYLLRELDLHNRGLNVLTDERVVAIKKQLQDIQYWLDD